jgi:hypothetical protein
MKSLNILSTSFYVGSAPLALAHRYFTSGIFKISAMCKSFLKPIGLRASYIEMSIPYFLNTLTNTTAGASTCISTVVPLKSNIAAFIAPLYLLGFNLYILLAIGL